LAVGYISSPSQWFSSSVVTPAWLQSVHDNQNYIWGTNSGITTPTPTAPTSAGASDVLAWFWASIQESGGTYSFQRGFNVSSISKSGTGDIRVNLRTGFPVASGFLYEGITATANGSSPRIVNVGMSSASIIVVNIYDAAGVAADGGFNIVGFGR
jgi:hypothetical protein